MNTHKLISVTGKMLKIGLIGFGGGTALIPVLEKELVTRSHTVTEESFNRDVTIASITPGALPVEIAAGIGREAAGNAGMIAAAACMALPGAFLTLLLLVLFSGMSSALKTPISFLAMLVSVYIIVLLGRYVLGTLTQAVSRQELLLYFFVILSVFLLSSEKNLYQLFKINAAPLFAVSSVQILAAAFFVILFTRGRLREFRRTVPAVLISLAYFLCVGTAQLFPAEFIPPLMSLMAVLSLYGLIQSIRESRRRPRKTEETSDRVLRQHPVLRESAYKKEKSLLQGLLQSVFFWILFLFLLSLPAILLTTQTVPFIGTGFLSSVMSFGGGDAYLSVAQGLFVENGVVSHSDFYGNIVTVANALPGSILCKVLTGVGYSLGFGLHGSIAEGILMAIAGYACSVAASGSIYIVIWAVFQKFENLPIFATIRHFIRPIVSGLLLNVALSLFLSVIYPFFR